MPPVNLLSEDSDSGEDLNEITIDEHYAKAFAYRKERQELERRKHTLAALRPIHDFQTHQATLQYNRACIRQ